MGLAQIKMPQLGESVTEGTVDKWLKHEGDLVKRDEPLVEVVTDKVNAEIPSPFEGKLVKITVAEGETVNVGAVLAQIEVEGKTAAPSRDPSPAEGPAIAPPATTAAAETAAPSPDPSPAEGPAIAPPATTPAAETAPPEVPAGTAAGDGERQRLSPAVRKLAREHDIDPASVRGSGMGGRVTRDDILAAVSGGVRSSAQAPAPAAAAAPARPLDGAREELVKLSVMRKSIAEHMVRSLATSPHAWTLQEADVTNLVKYRESEKEGFKARHGVTLTYLPFVAQITCDVIKQFPWLNSSWSDEGVILKHYINLGVAVSIPEGLIVPVLKDADQVGFTDLVRRLDDLIDRARNKKLKVDDVSGGTFTLNNTGATGSVASQPIINQPQAAILTTEAIVKRAVVVGDAIAVRHVMNVCLSFDHRIVDGMMAGQFLGAIKKRLEDWTPSSIKL